MESVVSSTLQHPGGAHSTHVNGVRLISLVQHRDERGPLAILGQDAAQMPFPPARIFFTYEANELARGAHAHVLCEQILICASGKLKVLVRDGEREQIIPLTGPEQALHLGPLVWSEQFDHAPGTVLMVLASHPYDETDYLRTEAHWREALAR
jgi:UDP-2-acetamido-3-amino-2,3-dideoxy-glucuronate N-acetyltransferase